MIIDELLAQSFLLGFLFLSKSVYLGAATFSKRIRVTVKLLNEINNKNLNTFC